MVRGLVSTGFSFSEKEYNLYVSESSTQHLEGVLSEGRDFNIPLQKHTDAGIEEASSADIIDFLFNRAFTVERTVEIIPPSDCSIRADRGSVRFADMQYGAGKLSFNLKSSTIGAGSVIAQVGKERVSASFKPMKVTKTNANELIVQGDITIRRGRVQDMKKGVVSFSKSNSLVSMRSADGVFSADGLATTIVRGCLAETRDFYLIHSEGTLAEKRSITEVRQLLNEHPEFRDQYEGLDSLFNDFWWLALPPGFSVS